MAQYPGGILAAGMTGPAVKRERTDQVLFFRGRFTEEAEAEGAGDGRMIPGRPRWMRGAGAAELLSALAEAGRTG